jgi:hypothetical protein
MRTVDRTSKIVLGLVSVMVGTSLAAGCGDDGDGGGGDVTTGIAPNKLLSDVTEAEAQSACMRLQSGFERTFDEDKLTEALCTITGVAFTDTTADCNMFKADCIQEASMSGTDAMEELGEVEFTCDGESGFAECTGTVGQLETCFNDILDQFEALLNQFSCDDAATVGEDDLEGFGSMADQLPASCEAVGCPEDPFEGDEEEVSGSL